MNTLLPPGFNCGFVRMPKDDAEAGITPEFAKKLKRNDDIVAGVTFLVLIFATIGVLTCAYWIVILVARIISMTTSY